MSLLFSDLYLRKQNIIFWNWYDNTRKTLVAFDINGESHFKTCGSISQLLSGK
jgi:hypothetical protein